MTEFNADGTPKYTRHFKRDLANNPEVTTWSRKPTKKLRYFYIDGKLHKVLHVNRPMDLATTFCYSEADYRQYPWSWLKKNHQRAYGIMDVANMVQRHRRHVQRCMLLGAFPRPEKAYSLKNPDRFTYYFAEDDILAVQQYFSEQHIGFKRKDGLITPQPLPTRTELKAMMQSDTVMYVRDPKNESRFIPVWREME
jgi:hypothetical protein